MDLDFDIDDSFPAEPYDHLLSPEATRVSDVYWLNSQPPPALRDIILQAPKPPPQREHTTENPWPWYDNEPTLDEPLPRRVRPLARTNSSLRARLGQNSGSSSPNLPSASSSNFLSSKEHDQLLSVFKGASEQLDENIAMRAAKCREASVGKRKKRNTNLSATAQPVKAKRVSTDSHHDSKIHRSTGISKVASVKDTGLKRAVDTRLPLFSSSSSSSSTAMSSSSSLYSRDTSLTMNDSSMMDTEADHIPASTSSYIPPISKVRPLASSHLTISVPATYPISESPSVLKPVPRMHPLIVEQQSRRRPAPSPPPPHRPPEPLPSFAHQPPSQNVPAPSQSSRPPPLGMRRTHTIPITSHQPLPTRQKSFKPPLLSQSQPAQPPARLQSQYSRPPITPPSISGYVVPKHPPAKPNAGRITRDGKEKARARPAPAKPPLPSSKQDDAEMDDEGVVPDRATSPVVESAADSSFGDMSFDMDALEETMRMYD